MMNNVRKSSGMNGNNDSLSSSSSSAHHLNSAKNNIDNKTNLIVNYLPQTMSDYEFKSLFLSVGPIKSARIIRHKLTGFSYGFGFVDYMTIEDAQRAINLLNGYPIENKKIKVALARQGGTDIKQANLYVKNIPVFYTQDEVEDLFAKFGTIIQCRILLNEAGNNKGVGFVLFDLHEQAEIAIHSLNGKQLPGATKPLEIKFAANNSEKVRSPEDTFVVRGGYSQQDNYPHSPPSYSGFSGSNTFSYFNPQSVGGPIRQTATYGNRNHRYNPLNSSSHQSMSSSESSLEPQPVPHPTVTHPSFYSGYSDYQYNSPSPPPITATERSENIILFVYNIGPQTDEKELWHLFSRHGRVIKTNVIRKGDVSKGYGFVTMSSYNEATLAIHNLNGINFGGRQLQVSIKK